jgi:hypothetical protein
MRAQGRFIIFLLLTGVYGPRLTHGQEYAIGADYHSLHKRNNKG